MKEVFINNEGSKNEANISAEKLEKKTHAWVPLPDGHRRGQESPVQQETKGQKTTGRLTGGDRSFGKRERLLKRSEFENVMENGRKIKVANVCTVFWLKNGLDRKRLGIIASRRIGNAVTRNRARRRIREAYRRIKNDIQTPMDIVIIAGKGAIPLPFPVLESKLTQTLRAQRRI